jgi:hypothetical protein
MAKNAGRASSKGSGSKAGKAPKLAGHGSVDGRAYGVWSNTGISGLGSTPHKLVTGEISGERPLSKAQAVQLVEKLFPGSYEVESVKNQDKVPRGMDEYDGNYFRVFKIRRANPGSGSGGTDLI